MTKKPKPFSYTDTDEARSRAIFEYKINHAHVKSFAEIRTTIPNTDGYMLICEEPDNPLGTIFVQLKKIPKDVRQFPCEAALFVTEGITLAPFIVVCVDVENERVFWKHLLSNQIEPGRKSATIYFDEDDEIKPDEKYLAKWVNLIKEYKAKLPGVSKVLEMNQVKENISVSELATLTVTSAESELSNYKFKTQIDLAKTSLDGGGYAAAKIIYENLLLEFEKDSATPPLARFKVHNNLACCYIHLGEESSAVIHFKIGYDALTTKPEIACRNRALACLMENKPLDGIPFIDQALALNPKSVENINMKVKILSAAGMPDKALELYLEGEDGDED